MEFLEAVRRRRMVRSYTGEPVAAEALDRILDAARRAPSAGFAQAVELVVVTEAAGRARLAELADEARHVAAGRAPWLSRAPIHIVIGVSAAEYERRYAEPDKSGGASAQEWPVPYWWVDAGATLMLVLLATANEGLAAGFLGAHGFDDLGAAVGFPVTFEAIGLVTIGHAADRSVVGSATRPRKPRSATEHSELWGNPRLADPAS